MISTSAPALLAIPGEPRNRIYDYVFPLTQVIVFGMGGGTPKAIRHAQTPLPLSVTLVRRQIYDETHALLYENSNFDDTTSMSTFVRKTLTQQQASFLRAIRFTMTLET